MNNRISLNIIFILALLVVSNSFFIINEKEQAIITQVGEFKRAITKPGLHFKKPFIEKITRFEKRILSTDAPPGQYLTLDKKRLVVDFLARWKIVDPLVFFKSVIERENSYGVLELRSFKDATIYLIIFFNAEKLYSDKEITVIAIGIKKIQK